MTGTLTALALFAVAVVLVKLALWLLGKAVTAVSALIDRLKTRWL